MHWLLSIWICAMPGGWGACRPLPVQPQPTLAVCRAAARAAQAADPHQVAHCRLRLRYRADRAGYEP